MYLWIVLRAFSIMETDLTPYSRSLSEHCWLTSDTTAPSSGDYRWATPVCSKLLKQLSSRPAVKQFCYFLIRHFESLFFLTTLRLYKKGNVFIITLEYRMCRWKIFFTADILTSGFDPPTDRWHASSPVERWHVAINYLKNVTIPVLVCNLAGEYSN